MTGPAYVLKVLVCALALNLVWLASADALLRAAGPDPMTFIVHFASFGVINGVYEVTSPPGAGLAFSLNLGPPQEHLPVIGYTSVSTFLLPLVGFLGCQALMGGASRCHAPRWVAGVLFGLGWFGVHLLLTLIHVLAVTTAQVPSPFFDQLVVPPHASGAPAWVGQLLWPTGLLCQLAAPMAQVAGVGVWWRLRGDDLASADAQR